MHIVQIFLSQMFQHRAFLCVISSFVISACLLSREANAQDRTNPEQAARYQISQVQSADVPDVLTAGRLNEFVMDGSESCLEIKKGSSSLRPAISAVTNAASYNNRIAPGGLAVLWGSRFAEPGEEYVASATPLPRLLGRVQVLWRAADWDTTVYGWKNDCGWRAAPLLYVGPGQINFQVPMFFYKPFSEDDGDGYGKFANFEGRDYEFIVLQVLRDGVTKVSSNTFKLKINSHAPEFFDKAVVDYPTWQSPVEIVSGQTMVAYITGLGKISDHEPEGSIPPNPPWTTRFPTAVEYRNAFGGRLLRTGFLFAGRAPGFTGLDQVNFIVPSLPAGSDGPISIHICTGLANADRCSEKAATFFYRTP
jgi:hypothetical protein